MKGSALWRYSAALVFVDDLDSLTLDDADAHHLGRVLRLRAGAEVCAADGSGGWRLCEFDGHETLAGTDTQGYEDAPNDLLTVGIALVKGDKPEIVAQKLTEIGVDRIVFFESRRSVVRWSRDKVRRNVERLQRVALSASCQSRRIRVPEVSYGDLKELVAGGAVVADFGGRKLETADRTILIGPEGGWDNDEYGVAEAVDLGGNVLRAETAAIVAAALAVEAARGEL